MNAQTPESQKALTPAAALRLLKDGNQRFIDGRRADRNLLQHVEATASGQWPAAIVLGCIDSRASAELIFDQGIGDIFNARIAGNFVNDDILGSMEFACQVAGAKLVVVLGHSSCGAIKGACDGVDLGLLTGLLDRLRPAVECVPEPADAADRTSQNAAFVDAAAEANVRLTVDEIPQRSDVLAKLAETRDIEIVGAMYDVATGVVRFL